MAVKTNINFRGISIQNAYCSLQDYSINKQYHDKNKNYCVVCDVFLYTDATKDNFLDADKFVFTVNDPADLTQVKLWKEIKKKYPGEDILD